MKRAKPKAVQPDDGMALLTDVAPGTASVVAVTNASADVDKHLAMNEIYRANAILGAYIAGLKGDDADDCYVLWTVQAILKDAAAIIDASPHR